MTSGGRARRFLLLRFHFHSEGDEKRRQPKASVSWKFGWRIGVLKFLVVNNLTFSREKSVPHFSGGGGGSLWIRYKRVSVGGRRGGICKIWTGNARWISQPAASRGGFAPRERIIRPVLCSATALPRKGRRPR